MNIRGIPNSEFRTHIHSASDSRVAYFTTTMSKASQPELKKVYTCRQLLDDRLIVCSVHGQEIVRSSTRRSQSQRYFTRIRSLLEPSDRRRVGGDNTCTETSHWHSGK